MRLSKMKDDKENKRNVKHRIDYLPHALRLRWNYTSSAQGDNLEKHYE